MRSDFSKPSIDIANEAQRWTAQQEALLARQRDISSHLQGRELRAACLLCGGSLTSSKAYTHRGIDYLACGRCGHFQTSVRLPQGYPHAQNLAGFEAIYPDLDDVGYRSRRDRIYAPKLDWLLARIEETGRSVEGVLQAKWLEIGCGAGYFLHALRARGASTVLGLDENNVLVDVANRQCGAPVARVSECIFSDLEQSDADVITAFFVLEHIEEAQRFWQILANKPSGTLFAFAVPTFGLSTVIEGALDGFAARNLDNVVHTQLYTDQSIDQALKSAGYQKVAEWLFGQDAQDLCSVLLNQLASHMDDTLLDDLAQHLSTLVDPLQQVIDRARLCDARHVLAVRQ